MANVARGKSSVSARTTKLACPGAFQGQRGLGLLERDPKLPTSSNPNKRPWETVVSEWRRVGVAVLAARCDEYLADQDTISHWAGEALATTMPASVDIISKITRRSRVIENHPEGTGSFPRWLHTRVARECFCRLVIEFFLGILFLLRCAAA
jgi:hypothetical protein